MNIGILTFHRVINYGAELQAYALQRFLQKNNFNAKIVDYWPWYRIQTMKFFSWNYFCNMSLGQKYLFIKSRLAVFQYNKRQKRTREFVNKYLKLANNKEYDILICGSDQIWRKIKYPPFNDYDANYFGCGQYRAKRVISYAASMGHVHFSTLEDEQSFLQLTSKVDYISVREKELQDYITTKCHREAKLVLDPVFLLDIDDWNYLIDTKLIPNFKYVLYYNHQGIKFCGDFADKLAQEKSCRVIEILPGSDLFKFGSRYNSTCNAQEFLSLLYGAEYVVSSSFHGFALAVRLGKQVFYGSNSKKSNRLTNLAKNLNIESQNISFINGEKIPFIDYKKTNELMEQLVNDSRQWLLQTVNGNNFDLK